MTSNKETLQSSFLKYSTLYEETIIRVFSFIIICYIFFTRGFWIGHDSIPFIAAHNNLENLPLIAHKIITALSGLSLILVSIKPKSWEFKLFTLLVLLIAGLMSINRIQPVLIAYVWIIFSFNHEKNPTRYALRIAICGIMIFTGLNHLHPSFWQTEIPTLLIILGGSFHEELIKNIGETLPYVEIAFGLALIIPNTIIFRISSILITIYLSILFVIFLIMNQFAFGFYILGLTLVALYLIWSSFNAQLFQENDLFQYPTMLSFLFLLIPTLGYFGLLDKHLSFEVFSGNTYRGGIVFPASVWKNMPEDIKRLSVTIPDLEGSSMSKEAGNSVDSNGTESDWFLDIDVFLVTTVNSIPYRSPDVYRKLASHFKQYDIEKKGYVLILKNGNTFTEGVDLWIYADSDL